MGSGGQPATRTKRRATMPVAGKRERNAAKTENFVVVDFRRSRWPAEVPKAKREKGKKRECRALPCSGGLSDLVFQRLTR